MDANLINTTTDPVALMPGLPPQGRYFSGPRPTAPATAFPELTSREHEVLDLIAAGLDNEAIAARLVISRKTARNHVSNIFSKLQVAGRAEAIIRARDAGMG